VTQQNAANAEQSAGASEELNVQAEQMKSTVDELGALVGETAAVEAVVDADGELPDPAQSPHQALLTTIDPNSPRCDRMISQDEFDIEDF
jgi:methyl-accepting chemotaxis protein